MKSITVKVPEIPKQTEKAHSDYSASGFEKLEACPGSVKLSRGIPDKGNKYSIEGTNAHWVHEYITKTAIAAGASYVSEVIGPRSIPKEMLQHARHASNHVLGIWKKYKEAEIMVEGRVYLGFIHKEAFGTLDDAVLEYFETMNIFDFKYGVKLVSPRENLQMIFYALGLAYKHHWNFKRIRLWIIQPRVKGYKAPAFWEISIEELKAYIPRYKKAVKAVELYPDKFVEGSWCHWCKAKKLCPLKIEAKQTQAKMLFASVPITKGKSDNGIRKNTAKSETTEKSSGKGQSQIKGKDQGKTKIRKEKSSEEKELARFYKNKKRKERQQAQIQKSFASKEKDGFY